MTDAQGSVQTSRAQRRISRLASALPVHRAFHWLHLYEPQLRLWQLEMLSIPAPPFGEQARAAWFVERFLALGLSNVHLDAAGNALGELSPEPESRAPFMAQLYRDMSGSAPELDATQNFLLVSAHLDTVLPAPAKTAPASLALEPATTPPASPRCWP